MESGVKCDSNVKEVFDQLATKKVLRYITFKISDDKTKIVVDQTGEREKTFEDFKNAIPRNGCRYAVFDLEYKTKGEGQSRGKVIFFLYVPDELPIKERPSKMLYSTSKQAIVKTLGEPVYKKFEISDHNDFDLDEIEKVMK